MKIFLSGPMTGYPNSNIPLFNELAAKLRANGHTVWNPAELPAGLSRNMYMALNLAAMNTEPWDILAQIDGWVWSSGATEEYLEAKKLGIKDVPVKVALEII